MNIGVVPISILRRNCLRNVGAASSCPPYKGIVFINIFLHIPRLCKNGKKPPSRCGLKHILKEVKIYSYNYIMNMHNLNT